MATVKSSASLLLFALVLATLSPRYQRVASLSSTSAADLERVLQLAQDRETLFELSHDLVAENLRLVEQQRQLKELVQALLGEQERLSARMEEAFLATERVVRDDKRQLEQCRYVNDELAKDYHRLHNDHKSAMTTTLNSVAKKMRRRDTQYSRLAQDHKKAVTRLSALEQQNAKLRKEKRQIIQKHEDESREVMELIQTLTSKVAAVTKKVALEKIQMEHDFAAESAKIVAARQENERIMTSYRQEVQSLLMSRAWREKGFMDLITQKDYELSVLREENERHLRDVKSLEKKCAVVNMLDDEIILYEEDILIPQPSMPRKGSQQEQPLTDLATSAKQQQQPDQDVSYTHAHDILDEAALAGGSEIILQEENLLVSASAPHAAQ